MADPLSAFRVGQTVELVSGQSATIRYLGTIAVSPGDWIGVELEDFSGKNDGSIREERYFECEMGKGMFVKPPSIVRITKQPPVVNGRASGELAVAKRRAPSVVAGVGGPRRQSVVDTEPGKRRSANVGSPTPGPRHAPSSRSLRSPTKSPTKQLVPSTSGAPSTTITNPSGMRASSVLKPRTRPSIGNRQPIVAPPPPSIGNRPSRQSLVGSSAAAAARLSSANLAATSKPPSSQFSARPGLGIPGKRLGSISGESQASAESRYGSPDVVGISNSLSPPFNISAISEDVSQDTTSPAPSLKSPAGNLLSPTSAAPSRAASIAQRATSGSAALGREVEDLKTKLRMMEKKRMEDREKLKAMERIQAERDKFEGIIQKLQSKYQPQQQELTDLRKQLKENAAKVEEMETQQAEHDIVLEMATLDREMAEESAEVLKSELQALSQKLEEYELEVEVLREENRELSQEMSPEEKASQGWLQMERNNERLREALLRLRDMTEQQESELKDQIKTLEQDLLGYATLKEQHDFTKERLLRSETGIEDLRQQLETALGAEEMIEDLTEKNLSMGELVEELRATIEDLESLKELNDELEVHHIETEKQMQEEIDYKENLMAEQTRRLTQQEQSMEDYEYTITRFRELVTNLQSDLEDMKSSQQLTETEAEALSNRSRAMMDLNMKLQVSASKTQIKTIDLELRRLEAQEAMEHLAIVQLFLPDAFELEQDSVLALLRFKRVGFKANLLHGFIKEGFTGQNQQLRDDDIIPACDALDKLTWVSAMCDRFANFIQSCSVPQFAKFEGALYELEPVERALNGWIDALKRDDLKEKQCATELQRTMALMSHLAEIHISQTLESFADDVQMRAIMMQSHLESTATALHHIKVAVEKKIPSTDEEDDPSGLFLKRFDNIISHSRSAKVVAGKIIRALGELKSRSLSLRPDTLPAFLPCESASRELAEYARSIGEVIMLLLSEEGRNDPFTFKEIEAAMDETTSSLFNGAQTSMYSAMSSKLRNLTNSLLDLGSLSSDLEMAVEFERPQAPWILRSQEIKSTKVVSLDVEEEIRRLKDDIHERATQIKLRDKSLEESAVKIELMESRMRDAGKKASRITELEKAVKDISEREKQLSRAMEAQTRELQALEMEKDRYIKLASEKQPIGDAGAGQEGAERAVATKREIDALQADIKSLQGAVRFLREDNRRARLVDPSLSPPAWLEMPLIKRKSAKEQRAGLVCTEGQDVLGELLHLASSAKLVSLKPAPKEERLKWRPQSATPRFRVLKQREEWETWVDWKDSVVRQGTALREKKAAALNYGLRTKAQGQPSKIESQKKGGLSPNVKIVGLDDTASLG
ncbi:MAG: hypothetical protein M1829_001458 [Trizodia sp. TS-e1964]|nr:MAG: hypothetical protein M1829_001458 [Trizodia sp. TS-e1964]